jgi:hypothetical protein
MSINPNLIPPVESFSCAGMIKPIEITKVGIQTKSYVYTIYHDNILIKRGISHEDNEQQWLSRPYRQIGHIKSWGKHRLTGQNGIDFEGIEADWLRKYGYPMDHNKIRVEIELLDDYPFETNDPRVEIENYESTLIGSDKDRYGKKPIGNKRHLNNKRTAPVAKVLNKHFDLCD